MADDLEKKPLQLDGDVLTPEEQQKRKQRSIVLAVSLLVFVVIIFFVTILRLGASIAERVPQ
jgi:hypothetical protein